jgi:hypothetical protein
MRIVCAMCPGWSEDVGDGPFALAFADAAWGRHIRAHIDDVVNAVESADFLPEPASGLDAGGAVVASDHADRVEPGADQEASGDEVVEERDEDE